MADLTLIECLSTNAYDAEARVLRDFDFLILVVGCGHPEGEPSLVDEGYGCELENVV
jgi:hypothetical protein